jgi:hypothetical protein
MSTVFFNVLDPELLGLLGSSSGSVTGSDIRRKIGSFFELLEPSSGFMPCEKNLHFCRNITKKVGQLGQIQNNFVNFVTQSL